MVNYYNGPNGSKVAAASIWVRLTGRARGAERVDYANGKFNVENHLVAGQRSKYNVSGDYHFHSSVGLSEKLQRGQYYQSKRGRDPLKWLYRGSEVRFRVEIWIRSGRDCVVVLLDQSWRI